MQIKLKALFFHHLMQLNHFIDFTELAK
uniref:Uncharacterized protein n=1 Tax=Arundo donax TaxID=35708 RepID=A0A0A9EUD7_ARUDO